MIFDVYLEWEDDVCLKFTDIDDEGKLTIVELWEQVSERLLSNLPADKKIRLVILTDRECHYNTFLKTFDEVKEYASRRFQ